MPDAESWVTKGIANSRPDAKEWFDGILGKMGKRADSQTVVAYSNQWHWTFIESQKQLAQMIGALVLEAESLRKRVMEIEAKGVVYRGVWQRADEYRRGDLTTHGGSMWHANTGTRAEPGKTTDWQLAVKAGRDAQ